MALTTPKHPYRIRNESFPILVIEDNKDHQLLIAYSLRSKVPLAHPVFASSAAEALSHLQLTFPTDEPFPFLVLLDIYLPDPGTGWQLLNSIRMLYPRLPIIVLSSHQDPDIVEKAYELGAHSFISKPLNLDQWEYYFRVLNEYWLGTVTLPSSR